MAGIAIPLRASGVAIEQGALILALLGSMAIAYRNLETRNYVKQAFGSRTAKLCLLLALAWGVTVTQSHDPLGSLEIGGRTLAFTGAAVLLWAALKSHPKCHPILWKSLHVATFAVTLTVVLALSNVSNAQFVLRGETLSLYYSTLVFKAFAASALCLVPIVVWTGRRLGGPWAWLGYAYIVPAVMVIIMTHNRSALAGLLVMILAMFSVLAMRNARHAKWLVLLAIGVSLAIIAWIRRESAHLGANLADNTYLPTWLIDGHRQNIWKFAWEKFTESPWVGHGIDQLNRLPGAKIPVQGLNETASTLPSHPHNWALEIIAETGLIGFLPFVVVLGYVAFRVVRRFLQAGDEGALAQASLMTGFWSSALFNFSIWAVWWQLTFLILFALVAATNHDDKPGLAPSQSP